MLRRIMLMIVSAFLLCACQLGTENSDNLEINQTQESMEMPETTEKYVYMYDNEYSMDDFIKAVEAFKQEKEYLYVYSLEKYSNDVITQLNEKVQKEINKKIRVIVIPDNAYLIPYGEENQYVQLLEKLIEKGIPVDVVSLDEQSLKEMAEKSYLVDWNEYLLTERGKALKAATKDFFWERTKINGYNYGPGNIDLPASSGWMVNAELLNKYGLSREDVAKDITELEAVLAKVAAEEGEGTVPLAFLSSTYYTYMPFVMIEHGLPIGFWRGSENADHYEVANLFATERMKEVVECINSYYIKGYLHRYEGQTSCFMLTDMEARVSYKDTVRNPFNPNDLNEYVQVEYYEKTSMDCTNLIVNAIPATSQNVEETRDFLQLIYTDQTITDLLRYGIEGSDYDVDKGTVVGKTSLDVRDSLTNRLLSSPYDPFEVPEKNEIAGEKFESLERNPLEGFIFDPSSVKEQVTRVMEVFLNNTYAESFFYAPAVVEEGDLGWEDYYEIMQRELETAGIDDVVEEMNHQIQQYLSQ